MPYNRNLKENNRFFNTLPCTLCWSSACRDTNKSVTMMIVQRAIRGCGETKNSFCGNKAGKAKTAGTGVRLCSLQDVGPLTRGTQCCRDAEILCNNCLGGGNSILEHYRC